MVLSMIFPVCYQLISYIVAVATSYLTVFILSCMLFLIDDDYI